MNLSIPTRLAVWPPAIVSSPTKPREAYGVRGACSRFRTAPHIRQREQAPRTPYASRDTTALVIRLCNLLRIPRKSAQKNKIFAYIIQRAVGPQPARFSQAKGARPLGCRDREWKWPLVRAVAVGLFLALSSAASAFVLSPSTMDFEPVGRGANRNFQLENPSDQPVAVQVSIVTRQMDVDGNETYSPADSDFTVYPPQTVLQPRQNQTIRVMWLGKTKPLKELNYRIVAEQLPVNLSKENKPGAKLNIMLRYLGTIYVVPKGAKSKVVLDSFSQEKAK